MIYSVATLAVLLGGLYVASGRATARIHAAYPPVGQFVTALGEDVHYVEAGAGQPVILLHGASGNVRDFLHGGLMERLAQNYRVIAFDRPGSGYTTRRAGGLHDPRRQAEVLAAAANALGAENPIVVGHSLGAAITMGWMMRHGARGAVLLGGAVMKRQDRPELLYASVDTPVIGHLLATAAPLMFGEDYIARSVEGVFAPQDAPAGYAADLGAPLATRPSMARATAADRNRLSPLLEEMSAAYPAIATPIEIITGDKDGSVPPEVHSFPAAELLPNARVTVLEGVGHMPHHARPEALEAALARLAGS
jgi:pimeloyl-ACP methyl ester carboxylesterase